MLANFILSAATIAAFLLLFGAWKIWRRGGINQKTILMIIAAAVILANVAIWSVPNDAGESLASEANPAV